MREADCYQLGEVIKTHGLKGGVSIQLDVDYPQEYIEMESVFLKRDGKLVPFFIESLQLLGDHAIVKFEDIDSLDQAKSIVKATLFLPLTELPLLEEGDYYFHDLIGCTVSEGQNVLGIVKSVYDLSGNELLEVHTEQGKEILIPMSQEILKQVDIQSKKIIVSLPEGLLDL